MTLIRPTVFEALRQRTSDETALPAMPIKVAALVCLKLHADAGGHVKCWQRLSEAAAEVPGAVDLTVHFTGEDETEQRIADNVRFHTWRPVFATNRLPFLNAMPDHTDLAGYHPRLARALAGCDVIHTTDAFFSFAATAMKVSRRDGVPVVNSIHTDTPGYSRVFTGRAIESVFGKTPLTSLLVDGLRLPQWVERDMTARLRRYQARSRYTLVSRTDDHRRAEEVLAPSRVWTLRRGIDSAYFTPEKRDRAWLRDAYGIPEDRLVVLYAGRLDRGKNVCLLADALKGRAGAPSPALLFCAGDGEDRQAIEAALGRDTVCPGILPQDTLARVYASADLFAFPSLIEISSNVVREALASGLPVLAARDGCSAGDIADGRTGLLLAGDDVHAWRRAIDGLAADRKRLTALGKVARRRAATELPSWRDVLVDDLLPVWVRAASESTRAAA